MLCITSCCTRIVSPEQPADFEGVRCLTTGYRITGSSLTDAICNRSVMQECPEQPADHESVQCHTHQVHRIPDIRSIPNSYNLYRLLHQVCQCRTARWSRRRTMPRSSRSPTSRMGSWATSAPSEVSYFLGSRNSTVNEQSSWSKRF